MAKLAVKYCHAAFVVSTHIVIIDGKPAEYENVNDIVTSHGEHASPSYAYTHTHLTTPHVPAEPAEYAHHGPCNFEHIVISHGEHASPKHTQALHHTACPGGIPRNTLSMVLVNLSNIVTFDGEHA